MNTLAETRDIAALATVPTLSSAEAPGPVTWTLEGPDGRTHTLEHEPRLW